MEESSPHEPRPRMRPRRRPERQQIMLRRALALGAGLVALILIVLGIKGCLDARADRELSDYARNVTEIVEETAQTSKAFFERLENPGELSENEFEEAVKADRSAVDNYAARVDGLSTPGDMSSAQDTLELVYELRANAMNAIANRMSTALGDAGAEKATEAIARQMQTLMASDVLYETIVRPEIDAVLASKGIEGSDVPNSTFVPDGARWLEESAVSEALGAISGNTGSSLGIHGLGLERVSINGVELAEGVTVTVVGEGTFEAEVEVQNQGESDESGVGVSVSYDGNTVSEDISTIAPLETAMVTIPLTPTPKGTVTLEVKVDTVPGEKVSENNEASFSVSFE